MNTIHSVHPGHVLIVIHVLLLLVLALRLADETAQRPRNHLIIMGGAMFAFALIYRMVDVLGHIDHPRWSSVMGGIGALAFLAADQRVAARYSRVWHALTGGDSTYTGPERRKSPRP